MQVYIKKWKGKGKGRREGKENRKKQLKPRSQVYLKLKGKQQGLLEL